MPSATEDHVFIILKGSGVVRAKEFRPPFLCRRPAASWGDGLCSTRPARYHHTGDEGAMLHIDAHLLDALPIFPVMGSGR